MPRVRPAPQPLTASALSPLIWLASSASPVGGFSYSEGLESAIDSGQVTDEASAGRWLRDQLGLSLQRAELPLPASAFKTWQPADNAQATAPIAAQITARISELNRGSLLTRESRELRQQTAQMGRSMTDWLRQRRPGSLADALPAAVDAAIATAAAGDGARQNLAPVLAITSARHEAQYSRLFRS